MERRPFEQSIVEALKRAARGAGDPQTLFDLIWQTSGITQGHEAILDAIDVCLERRHLPNGCALLARDSVAAQREAAQAEAKRQADLLAIDRAAFRPLPVRVSSGNDDD